MKELRFYNYGSYKQKVKNNKRIKKVKYPDYEGNEPCTQIPTEIFYPEKDEFTSKTLKDIRDNICGRCPMFAPCLEYALFHELHGLWAGTTPRQRKDLRKQMGIAVVDVQYIDTYLEYERNGPPNK